MSERRVKGFLAKNRSSGKWVVCVRDEGNSLHGKHIAIESFAVGVKPELYRSVDFVVIIRSIEFFRKDEFASDVRYIN